MNDEALAEFEKLGQLIDDGVLPLGAFPRLAYCGHDVVHTYGSQVRTHRCIQCRHEWQNEWGAGPDDQPCTSCGAPATDVYIIDWNRTARWACVACKHEWDGEDGTTCPSCGHDFPQYRDRG